MKGSLVRRDFPGFPTFWRDPFRRLERFFDDDFFTPFRALERGEAGLDESVWMPAIDVREGDDEIVVSADLPGLTKEDIEVTVEANRLTVSGERKWDEETREDRYHRIERAYGKFSRTLTLPSAVEAEKVKASFKDGILNVAIPKAEVAKRKKIAVH
jgi:HSP20 family protein